MKNLEFRHAVQSALQSSDELNAVIDVALAARTFVKNGSAPDETCTCDACVLKREVLKLDSMLVRLGGLRDRP